MPLSESNFSVFLSITIPKSINKITRFGKISNQMEINSLNSFFQKIIEIIPKIQNHLNNDSIYSISLLFDNKSNIFEQNKSLIYTDFVKMFIKEQDEIINTLKSINLDDDFNFSNYLYLIISIIQKIKQSKERIKGINRHKDTLKCLFFDFLEANVSNCKLNVSIISKIFDLLLNFIENMEIPKFFKFFEDNLESENIEIQKIISHCLSKFCQIPSFSKIICSIESKSPKINNFLLSKTFVQM